MNDSLQGLRILNTRPQGQAEKLSDDICEAGGIAINLPTIEIKATSKAWINSLPDLKSLDQAIFISANAVKYCFTQLKQHQIIWPSSIEVLAIGQGSANALSAFDVRTDAIPEIADSEHLLALKNLQNPTQKNILLIKGEDGRPLIENKLLEKGANLTILKVYQRIMPEIPREFIHSLWHNDAVDIILITSEQSLLNLFKLFDKKAHDWLKNKAWLMFSSRLAQSAADLGIQNVRISHPEQVMNTLFDYVHKD